MELRCGATADRSIFLQRCVAANICSRFSIRDSVMLSCAATSSAYYNIHEMRNSHAEHDGKRPHGARKGAKVCIVVPKFRQIPVYDNGPTHPCR